MQAGTPRPQEIVWIDTSTDPTTVFLRDGDASHYFYWPYEISAAPIKANDVEPVRCVVGQYTIMIARFHYHGLTIWINPTTSEINGKVHPIAVMMRNFHTPMGIPSKDSKVVVESVYGPSKLPLEERIVYAVARRVFTTQIRFSPPTANRPEGYSSKFSQLLGSGVIGKEQLFDESYVTTMIRELILVGSENAIKDVKEQIALYNPNRWLTPDGVIETFQFRPPVDFLKVEH